MASLDLAFVRASFPAVSESRFVYADNAGGSQCLGSVVSRISDYLLHTNVQLGADYSVSVASTSRVNDGIEAARELLNAASVDEVAFGSSSTMLAENLARALDGDILDDEEIIITGEHEANGGPWKKIAARRNLTLNYWHARPGFYNANNPYSVSLQIDDVLPLISPKTRIVTFTACSNILGTIVPVKEAVRAIRKRAAELGVRKLEVCVDCVAYAPHRRIDVQDWDVDYCFFSVYKVYGPHIAVLYARAASLQDSVSSLSHHFLDVKTKSYKLQPGGPGYELVYACTGVTAYLKSLSVTHTIEATFELIKEHEQGLIARLLMFLRSDWCTRRGVRIVGDHSIGPARVPTISFVVIGDRAIRSQDIVKAFDQQGDIGIRYGHFYAYTLIDHLEPKIDVSDAVVRISLVHYNTVEDVERIISVLSAQLMA
ncbi:hypothetical protein NLI96_g1854 [Meripilus lineatus]|uniref:Aminotransferase class V domain-containing protein n=1 Tax=Meripilus lineatus TaxID=2056292 RepID=A0AAD5V9V5_9APHY|nr:hypothetical protein NLI96_g1854 [Physisporinus lineatus]